MNFLQFLKLVISFFFILKVVIITLLPKYLFIVSYNHIQFKVHHYLHFYNNKVYSLKIIDDIPFDETKINTNRNLINHCCITNCKGEYLKDITASVRTFMHYNKIIKWENILIHLNIDINTETNLLYVNNDLDEFTFNTKYLVENKNILYV